MSDIFMMPDLSDITTEIDIDSMSSACSTWNSSIASIDINPNSLEKAFQPLINNGVAKNSISSISNSLNQISNIVTSISSYLKNNIDSQIAADDYILNSANESSNLYDLIPTNQYSLSGSKSTNTSFDSSRYGNSTSIDNKNKNLDINKDSSSTVETLSGNEFSNNDTSLINIQNDSETSANVDMNNFQDILNESLQEILNENDLSEIEDIILGDEVAVTALKRMAANNLISDEIKKIFYKYLKDKITLQGMGNKEEYYLNFPSISNEVSKIIDSKRNLMDLYDGNNCSDISENSITFMREMIDELAEKNNLTVEELLTNPNYNQYVNSRINEIGLVLKDYKSNL